MLRVFVPRRFIGNIHVTANIRTIQDIPGPKSYPIVGTVLNYLPGIGKYDPNRMHKTAAQWYHEFGPVVLDKPFNRKIVFIFDPRDIQELLQSIASKWPVRDSHNVLKYVRVNELKYETGGMFPENNEVWSRQRTLFQKELSFGESSKYVDRLDKLSSSLVDNLLGETIKPLVESDFMKVIHAHVTGVAWNVIFGNEWNLVEELKNSTSYPLKMGNYMIDLNEEVQLADTGTRIWKLLSVPLYQKIKQKAVEVNKLGERLLRIRTGEDGTLKPKYDDVMLDNWIRDGKATPNELKTFLADAFLAATDTTTYTIAFAFYLLSTNERVQSKLYEELLEISPDPTAPVTAKSLSKATYLKKIVKETFRLFPVSIGFSRKLPEDTLVGGYLLPKGTQVVTCNQVISRMPEWVDKPNEFIPERYDPQSGFNKIHPYVSLPFGHGARMCIARRFAEIEIYTLLFKVFRQYEFKWNSPQGVDCICRQLNKPDVPLKFIVTRRGNFR